MKGYNFKTIAIWFLIFVVGSLIVSFLISPNSFQSFKSNIKSMFPSTSNSNSNSNLINNPSKTKILTDFEDINRNPGNYLGKTITIRGKYKSWGSMPKGEVFSDNNGYSITVDTVVVRNLDIGQTYTFTGVFTKGQFIYYLAEQ